MQNIITADIPVKTKPAQTLSNSSNLIGITHNLSCIDGMTSMDANIVDLVVTSPPYDNLREYNKNTIWNFDIFKEVAKQLSRVLVDGGVIVWNVNDSTIGGSETGSSFRQALYFKDECGLRLHDTMFYGKKHTTYPAGKDSVRYTNILEYVFILSKGKPKSVNIIMDKPNKTFGLDRTPFGDRYVERLRDGTINTRDKERLPAKEFGARYNIWWYGNGYNVGQTKKGAYKHPATMPEGLARDHIISWSNEGDVVMDPFAGSGTTYRMCRELNRKYIGFEIDAEYCKLANEL